MRRHTEQRIANPSESRPTACQAERELEFAGFIAFECLVRKDSGLVVGALQESDHKVRACQRMPAPGSSLRVRVTHAGHYGDRRLATDGAALVSGRYVGMSET